jgi:DNA-directed RNA polymerase sigma subunit (sigma70/sigma32)
LGARLPGTTEREVLRLEPDEPADPASLLAAQLKAAEAADPDSANLLRAQLEAVFHTLSEREKRVIQLRFGLLDGHPRTLEEVGRELGITSERVRQIESETLRKMTHPSRSRTYRREAWSMLDELNPEGKPKWWQFREKLRRRRSDP